MHEVKKAMIFAAGLGTRLKPMTDSIPKALVLVGGKPLLWHVINKLKSSGIEDFVVNVHHFPDAIIKYLNDNDLGVKISVSDESRFLRETGGGIRFAESLLSAGGIEPFIVHNVDILSDLNIQKFVSAAKPEALSTIVVSERKTSRYFLFDSGMRLCGWTNIATGEVKTPYENIDLMACRKLAFSGIHLMSGDIFNAFEKEKAGDRFSITDFYIRACADYPIYGYLPDKLKLMDVGKIETVKEAESFLQAL
ncbi:MAG: nucleotidyltransferase family protein [Bacteroidales bacterium]